RLGVKVEARLESIGFAPIGGGRLEVLVEPVGKLEPADWLERGSLLSQQVRVLSQNLDEGIASRMANAANAAMGWESEPELEVWTDGPSPGVACFVESNYEHVSEITTDFGKVGRRAESVGNRAAKAMQNYLGSKAVVGRHLADQLLLPMALSGRGNFVTMGISNHVRTNLRTIQAFLDIEISVSEEENGLCQVAMKA
ncbi:MAG: RNA 3'-terminal phosphate cyclase, partial [Verrucomicrobiota bacterium]